MDKSNDAPVDGEAGDLEALVDDFGKACVEYWRTPRVFTEGKEKAGIEKAKARSALLARLSPSSKQGTAESLLHDMAAYKTSLEGKIAKIHSVCVQTSARRSDTLGRTILAIIEGGAGNGGGA